MQIIGTEEFSYPVHNRYRSLALIFDFHHGNRQPSFKRDAFLVDERLLVAASRLPL